MIFVVVVEDVQRKRGIVSKRCGVGLLFQSWVATGLSVLIRFPTIGGYTGRAVLSVLCEQD